MVSFFYANAGMDLPAHCKVLYLYTLNSHSIRLAGLAAFVKFSRSCDLWQLRMAAAARIGMAAGPGFVKFLAAGIGQLGFVAAGIDAGLVNLFTHVKQLGSWIAAATMGSCQVVDKLQMSCYIFIFIFPLLLYHTFRLLSIENTTENLADLSAPAPIFLTRGDFYVIMKG